MDGPFPSNVENIPTQSSLPAFPPGIINMTQWGKTRIAFGKYKGRNWSYEDLLSAKDDESRSYVRWCRARASTASGDLRDLASYLFRHEMETSHTSMTTSPRIPGTDRVREFKG